jgi:hypothetical protein
MLPAMHREENLADEWSSLSKDDVKYGAYLALFQEALGPIEPSFLKDHLLKKTLSVIWLILHLLVL